MTVIDALDLDPALGGVILNLGQSKQVLAREVSAWTLRAPWLEAGITLAKIAQDELGHGQVLAQMHADHFSSGRKRSVRVGLRDEITHPAVQPFAARTESWPDLVALMCFWDQAIAAVLETLTQPTTLPLRNSIAKMCKDEQYHWLFAHGSARELLARDGRAPEAFVQASKALTPKIRRWFDSVGDLGRFFGAGIESQTTPLARYASRVGPLLEELNVSWPALSDVT